MDKGILQIKLTPSIAVSVLIYWVFNPRFNIKILHFTHSFYVAFCIILPTSSNISPNNLTICSL